MPEYNIVGFEEPKSQLPKKLLPFFWHFISPYKFYAAGLVLVTVIWAIHVSITPYVMKLLIDGVANYQGDPAQLGSAVFWPAFYYVLLSVAMGITFRLYDFIHLKLMPNLKHDIQQQMLFYLEGHSHNYFQNNFAGSLSNKIMDMSRGVPEILSMSIDSGIACILGVLFATVAMYLVQPIFAFILIIWAAIYFYVTWRFSLKARKYATVLAEAKSALSGKQVDSISNVTNIRLFAKRKFEVGYVKKYIDDTINKDRKIQWYLLKVRVFQFLSMSSVLAAMLYFLIKERIFGLITVGDFALILGILVRLLDALWNVANNFVRFSQEVGTCAQALSIITPPHEIVDIEGAKPLIVSKGNINFDNVTFAYYGGKPAALVSRSDLGTCEDLGKPSRSDLKLFQNKHVEIEAGTKVGLVGFSGSGKTTFVNLILRFFDVESGSILIDGQDIAKVTQDSLHENISMIPQDTSLFHRSLMENIRYGRLDASDAEVLEASRKAHCHEFISVLPDGYNSLVGERGIKLSGGQRQRIAIARAMLKDAPILILDEATSALDSITEKYIQSGLETLMQGRTTIVIAHRLSTLSEMDRILVFDKGKIIEDGTHKKLLRSKGGHYTKMWEMQAGGFLPDVAG
jgi:ATP-binding cassette subfamily B protein